MHGNARLENFPDVIDRRPLIKEDSFQMKMYDYAVNSNRDFYTEIADYSEDDKELDKHWQKIVDKMRRAINDPH